MTTELGRIEPVSEQTKELADLIDLIRRQTCLDENQAKTVAYFAIATHGLEHVNTSPVLTIYGAAGTGKTTILRILKELVHNPDWMDGKMTRPVLRDSLKPGTTALIDEADKIYEQFLVNRFSRHAPSLGVNRKQQHGGYEKERLTVFGATALNRRIPFKDPAILSRAIVVRTKMKREGVQPFTAASFASFRPKLEHMASNIQWDAATDSPSHRVKDAWNPLLGVARSLGDMAWIAYANREMDTAIENLVAGQEEEPSAAVYQALLNAALEGEDGGVGNEPRERILLAAVAAKVQAHNLNPWQVGEIVRQLGFETRKAGGQQYVYTGGDTKLRSVGRELGIKDDWLDVEGG